MSINNLGTFFHLDQHFPSLWEFLWWFCESLSEALVWET